MKYKITEILEVDKISTLLESYTAATGLVSALLDLEGNILSKSGWQEICTEFHRKNPETATNCKTSDTVLSNKLGLGGKFNVYKCLNGLVDVAVPLVVNNEHIGNLFTGQFLLSEPDKDFFLNQAKKYNFDSNKYMFALTQVPIVKEEDVKDRLNFLLQMTEVIAELGLSRINEIESNEALKLSEKKYRTLFKNMNEGFALHEIILDEEGNPFDYKFLEINSSFANLTGLDPQKVVGRTARETIPGIDKESANWIERYGKVALTGEDISFEEYSDVLGKWFLVHAFRPEERQFAVSFTDITERKNIEKTLQKSEKHNQTLMDSLPIGLVLSRLDGTLVSTNPAYEKIMGYSKEELLKLSYWDLTPKKYEKQEYEKLDKLIKTGQYEFYEKEYIRKDGSLVPVRLSGILLTRNDEKLIWSSVEDITQQKIAENELKLSESKFEKAFNTSPYLIAITQLKDGKFIDVNNTFLKVTGYNRDEIIQNSTINVDLWTDINERKKMVSDLKTKNGVSKFETVFRKKNGETFPVAVSASVIELHGQQCILGSIEDITERKQSHEALLNSERKFRALIEQSITGIYIFGKEHFLYVNKRFCEIFGYTEQEILSTLKPVDVVGIEDQSRAQENIKKRLENNKRSVHYIARGKHKDNRPLWIEIHGTSIELDGEQVITGTVLDITDKYLATQEIKKSENRFRTLFEQAAVGVAVVDTNTGNYISVNQKHCDITGYPENELLQLNFKQITYSDDMEQDLAFMEQLKTGTIDSYSMEKRYLQKDGSVVWVALSVSPLWKKGEKPSVHIAVIEDITERKENEAELKKYRENLEELVHKRTKELEETNIELVQNIKKLERFNQLFVDREFRIKELKDKIKNLENN